MWFRDAPVWRIHLGERRLIRTIHSGLWPRRSAGCDSLEWVPRQDAEPWRGAVSALAQLLAGQGPGARAPQLQVVLSGAFVRWQILAWRPELTRPKELAAYASLRFTETFGKAARDWDVLHSPQPPGKAVPACAVDAALMQALRSVCQDSGARLDLVTPYFASALDRGCPALKSRLAWFGAIEPERVTLALLQNGDWLGLHSQRVEDHWRDVLPGMMARVAIAAGLAPASAALHLTGLGPAQVSGSAMPFVWLAPRDGILEPADARRMAPAVVTTSGASPRRRH